MLFIIHASSSSEPSALRDAGEARTCLAPARMMHVFISSMLGGGGNGLFS